MKNRRLSEVGEKIFQGKEEEIFISKSIGVEEAEYLRMVELNGVGKRNYTNLRLRLLPRGVSLPNYKQLVEFEQAHLYPIEPFLNGWKANLPKMAEVGLSVHQIPSFNHQ